MKHNTQTEDLTLRAALMRHFADMPLQHGGGTRHEGPGAFTYACLTRERLSSVTMPNPVLGIVLRGTKEVWFGDTPHRMPAGTLFALPRGVLIDVLNIPDERSGHYQSLLIEVSELPQGVAPLTADEARKPGQLADFSIPLTPDLVDAVGNARRELRDPSARAEVCRHRLAEILVLLRRVPQARSLFWQTLPDRIEWLVRSDPAAPWTVEVMAARMGMSASTLRRHLSQAGQSFRAIVRAARMDAARDALAQGAPAGVAAELAGYASRSHFARRFREAFGTSPAEFA